MPQEQSGQMSFAQADGHLVNYDYKDELRVWNFKRLLNKKYDVVVTNPPYMGSSGMGAALTEFVKKNYPDSKSDLFAAFIEQSGYLVDKCGFLGMITQHAWMFLSSYEKLRSKLFSFDTVNMAHLGPRAFAEIGGEVVQATTFVMRKGHIRDCKGCYVRLVDFDDAALKEEMFLSGNYRYFANSDNFEKIPGSPISYWVSENMLKIFCSKQIKDYGFAGIGMRTGNNERFLRFWSEIDRSKFGKKWIPYNKGGEYRKWYGNNDYVVNWENNGFEIKEATRKTYPQLGDNLGWKISNEKYYFLPGITWTSVTSGDFSCRCYEDGFIFDSGANGLFAYEDISRYYLAGCLNSLVINKIVKIINPTINNGAGMVNSIPVIVDRKYYEDVLLFVKTNIELSCQDWNSFEESWDFSGSPLV